MRVKAHADGNFLQYFWGKFVYSCRGLNMAITCIFPTIKP